MERKEVKKRFQELKKETDSWDNNELYLQAVKNHTFPNLFNEPTNLKDYKRSKKKNLSDTSAKQLVGQKEHEHKMRLRQDGGFRPLKPNKLPKRPKM